MLVALILSYSKIRNTVDKKFHALDLDLFTLSVVAIPVLPNVLRLQIGMGKLRTAENPTLVTLSNTAAVVSV